MSTNENDSKTPIRKEPWLEYIDDEDDELHDIVK